MAKKLGPKKVILFGYSMVILATLLSPIGAELSPYALAALQAIKGMCGVSTRSRSLSKTKRYKTFTVAAFNQVLTL